MSVNDNHCNRVGSNGRVWANPRAKKSKRFTAWFEKGYDIQVKRFSTRWAAILWLRQMIMKNWHP